MKEAKGTSTPWASWLRSPGLPVRSFVTGLFTATAVAIFYLGLASYSATSHPKIEESPGRIWLMTTHDSEAYHSLALRARPDKPSTAQLAVSGCGSSGLVAVLFAGVSVTRVAVGPTSEQDLDPEPVEHPGFTGDTRFVLLDLDDDGSGLVQRPCEDATLVATRVLTLEFENQLVSRNRGVLLPERGPRLLFSPPEVGEGGIRAGAFGDLFGQSAEEPWSSLGSESRVTLDMVPPEVVDEFVRPSPQRAYVWEDDGRSAVQVQARFVDLSALQRLHVQMFISSILVGVLLALATSTLYDRLRQPVR